MIEFLWAYLANVQIFIAIVFCVLVAYSFFIVFNHVMNIMMDMKDAEKSKRQVSLLLKLWLWSIPFLIIAWIPSPADLFKIRINLIKYELASPENVGKSQQALERIAHELECKYLDNCEDKK